MPSACPIRVSVLHVVRGVDQPQNVLLKVVFITAIKYCGWL